MTDEQIIIAVVKLDGWEEAFPRSNKLPPDKGGILLPYRYEQVGTGKRIAEYPDFLHSRDAIIPVIESQLGDSEERWSKFLHELGKLVGFHLGMEVPRWNLMKRFMFATPRQLCIALLKATNRWSE